MELGLFAVTGGDSDGGDVDAVAGLPKFRRGDKPPTRITRLTDLPRKLLAASAGLVAVVLVRVLLVIGCTSCFGGVSSRPSAERNGSESAMHFRTSATRLRSGSRVR